METGNCRSVPREGRRHNVQKRIFMGIVYVVDKDGVGELRPILQKALISQLLQRDQSSSF